MCRWERETSDRTLQQNLLKNTRITNMAQPATATRNPLARQSDCWAYTEGNPAWRPPNPTLILWWNTHGTRQPPWRVASCQDRPDTQWRGNILRLVATIFVPQWALACLDADPAARTINRNKGHILEHLVQVLSEWIVASIEPAKELTRTKEPEFMFLHTKDFWFRSVWIDLHQALTIDRESSRDRAPIGLVRCICKDDHVKGKHAHVKFLGARKQHRKRDKRPSETNPGAPYRT